MALADPQSITYDGNAVSLPRTGSGPDQGFFRDNSGEFEISVKHYYNGRARHVSRLDRKVIVSNPLVPDQNMNVSAHVHSVIDVPKNGMDVQDAIDMVKAYVDWLSANTYAIATKICGGES